MRSTRSVILRKPEPRDFDLASRDPLAQQDAERRRQRVEQLGTGADAVANRHACCGSRATRSSMRGAPRCCAGSSPPGPAPRSAAPADHDAREPAAAQPILVIHRRLVDEVRELRRAGRAAVPEEHEIAARARPRASRSRRRCAPAASRPAAAGRRRQHGVHQVEAREIDEPGVRPGRLARALVAGDHVASRDRDDELAAAAVERDARDPRRPARPRSGTAPPCGPASESADRDPAPSRAPSRTGSARPWRRCRAAPARCAAAAARCLSSAARIAAVSAAGSWTLTAFRPRLDGAGRQRLGAVARRSPSRRPAPRWRRRRRAATRSRPPPTAAGSPASSRAARCPTCVCVLIRRTSPC